MLQVTGKITFTRLAVSKSRTGARVHRLLECPVTRPRHQTTAGSDLTTVSHQPTQVSANKLTSIPALVLDVENRRAQRQRQPTSLPMRESSENCCLNHSNTNAENAAGSQATAL
jgi:hypothetical protein